MADPPGVVPYEATATLSYPVMISRRCIKSPTSHLLPRLPRVRTVMNSTAYISFALAINTSGPNNITLILDFYTIHSNCQNVTDVTWAVTLILFIPS